jgi:hypothetical protein
VGLGLNLTLTLSEQLRFTHITDSSQQFFRVNLRCSLLIGNPPKELNVNKSRDLGKGIQKQGCQVPKNEDGQIGQKTNSLKANYPKW